jgi:hypothetical protein
LDKKKGPSDFDSLGPFFQALFFMSMKDSFPQFTVVAGSSCKSTKATAP